MSKEAEKKPSNCFLMHVQTIALKAISVFYVNIKNFVAYRGWEEAKNFCFGYSQDLGYIKFVSKLMFISATLPKNAHPVLTIMFTNVSRTFKTEFEIHAASVQKIDVLIKKKNIEAQRFDVRLYHTRYWRSIYHSCSSCQWVMNVP